MNCSSSSDPAVVYATLLYDSHNDEENLWFRQSQDVPLPPCSSIAHPPDSHCTVCVVNQVVYAVCRNLAKAVKLVMEREGHNIEIFKSDCPKLLSDEYPQPLSDDAPQWQLPVAIIVPIFIAVIIISVVVYKGWKRYSNSRGMAVPTNEENKPSDLGDGTVMSYTELNRQPHLH